MRLLSIAIALLVLLGSSARAQSDTQGGPWERIALRVSSTRPGGVVMIDRGSSDGVQVGDNVFLYPRNAPRLAGVVIRVDERNATVQLQNPGVKVPNGVRGEVQVPTARFEEDEEPDNPSPEVVEEPVAQEPDAAVEEPEERWENEDEDYEDGMPLLARVSAVRPERRAPRITGRVYSIADARTTSESGRSDGFYRLGTDLRYDNPFGKGGSIHFDGEVNYRHTNVPDNQNEESRGRVRIDRISYSIGGTRFANERYEIGRFLQKGMPEFGVLDGAEWGRRLENGHRIGASVGWMPEPNPDFETGRDIQLAAFYEWVDSDREEWTAAGGFQKTWHNGAADRDLFIAKLQYLPTEGWNFHTTAWVDFYTSGDNESGLELTQAYARAGHRWDNGDSLDITYSHLQFPEIDRNEFLPVTPRQIDNDHRERLALSGWKRLSNAKRLHGHVGGWFDEDDEGADASVGVDFENLFVRRSHADATLFSTIGEFTTVYGARFLYGRDTRAGRWDVMYEISNHDQAGFDENNDDIPHHRVRGTYDFLTPAGWNVSVYGDVTIWDEEGALSAGFYLQRSF